VLLVFIICYRTIHIYFGPLHTRPAARPLPALLLPYGVIIPRLLFCPRRCLIVNNNNNNTSTPSIASPLPRSLLVDFDARFILSASLQYRSRLVRPGLAALSPVLELGKSPLPLFLRPPVISPFASIGRLGLPGQHALTSVGHFHRFRVISYPSTVLPLCLREQLETSPFCVQYFRFVVHLHRFRVFVAATYPTLCSRLALTLSSLATFRRLVIAS
jgi:hypothetical protein